MFYVILIVFLVCLLITIYFHHKTVCSELDNIKKLIKKNNGVFDMINEIKKEPVIEIPKVMSPIEELDEVQERKENIETNNEQLEITDEDEKKEEDEVNNILYESITEEQVEETSPIIHIPSLNELEQQIIRQINNDIDRMKISENMHKIEVVEDEETEEPADISNVEESSQDLETVEEIEENDKEEVIITEEDEEKKEEEKKEDVSEEEKKEEVVSNEKSADEEEISLDINAVKDIIAETKEENKETKDNVIENKISPVIINDLLTGDYKYQQLVKKCKENGIDVQRKKKEEIFNILRSML